ncbi:MAG TPA: metal ABC transporter substrate-binding protein [Candidatus Dormibacteraeota bacterium]
MSNVVAKILAAVAAVGLAVACGGGSSPSSGSNKPVVVTTVTQVSALTRAVGGDRISLTALLVPTDDPHSYELKPAQVTRLAGAAVIFQSGVEIDKWLDKGVDAANVKDRVVDLSRSVRLREATGETSGQDPHWWYDADNAKQATAAIAQALAKADPAGTDTYERNAAAESQRLDAADRSVHQAIDPIPQERRLFVANHDAFGYFLARYGITLVGDIVPSTDSMSAVRPADITRLVAAIQSQHVCAIFTETTIDPKLVNQIAAESKAKVYDGKLYGDAIGDPGSPGGTMEGALTRNGQLMAMAFKSC